MVWGRATKIKRIGHWFVLPAALLTQGCDINYASFVTSTHIGIKADTKVEQVSIGIGRADLFVGPAYPAQGTVPSVMSSLQSDGQIISPQVTQLYATGAAADAVTQAPGTIATPVIGDPDLSGVRRPFVFGTGTNIGLKIGFAGNLPTTFNFGYDREEFSIIPLQPTLNGTASDRFSPVLAAVKVNVQTTTVTGSGLQLGQFFATGNAAINLANRNDIRNIFGDAAKEQINQAAVQAAIIAANQDVATVKSFLDGSGGYAANCAKLKAKPAFVVRAWPVADPCALSEASFIDTLNQRPDLAGAAALATRS
jgi:hypothetical protein